MCGSGVSGSGLSLGFFCLGLGLGSQHGLLGRVFPLQAESKRRLDRVMGLFRACSKRRGAGRMTRSNEEMAPFEERALGCAFSMAHKTASFRLHRTASFGKRRYWGLLWSEMASSRAVPSFLSETSSSAAGGIRIFLFLSYASSSSSKSDFSSEIFSSSSSHRRGYE
jgi:hypothetical protein